MKTWCNCEFDTQKVYTLYPDGTTKSINIDTYFKNKNKIENDNVKLICGNKKDIIICNPPVMKPYFIHKNHNNDAHDFNMISWHKDWQKNFEQIEVKIGNRRADAIVNNIVLEFQHRLISKDNVNLRIKNYKINNYDCIWIVNCEDRITVQKHDLYYITIIKCDWQYTSFTGLEYIYFDFEDTLYKINPNSVKSNKVITNDMIQKNVFIESIKNNIF
jgi:hypothetical protein